MNYLDYRNIDFSGRFGFTLLEILIVSGLVVVVGTFTVVMLQGWRENKELNVATQQMATLLRDAVNKSMLQADGTSWGVHFDNVNPLDPHYAIFYSDTYAPTKVAARYPLPRNLRFDFGGGVDCVFSQISGELNSTASNGLCTAQGIKILVATNQGVSSTVTIAPRTGSITYTVLSCTIFGCVSDTVTLPPERARDDRDRGRGDDRIRERVQ